MGIRHYLLIAAVAVAACGAESDVPDLPVPIVVRNRSQFELLDLRFHPLEGYAEIENLLTAPLGVEGAIELMYRNGDYVTAMRRKIEVGDVIAITSSAPLPTLHGGERLIVFDMSFRVEGAVQSE